MLQYVTSSQKAAPVPQHLIVNLHRADCDCVGPHVFSLFDLTEEMFQSSLVDSWVFHTSLDNKSWPCYVVGSWHCNTASIFATIFLFLHDPIGSGFVAMASETFQSWETYGEAVNFIGRKSAKLKFCPKILSRKRTTLVMLFIHKFSYSVSKSESTLQTSLRTMTENKNQTGKNNIVVWFHK